MAKHPAELPSPTRPAIPEDVIFGRCEEMAVLRDKTMRVAPTDVPVLIRGESGTGKEVIAQVIHAWSPWRDGPFIKINCPAIPGTLLESELFGYEKGAFTGAYGPKPGLVEVAAGGTLFLDEIAELEIGLQAKVLHLLQDGTFTRLGGQEDKRVDVRILCATNRVLEQGIAAGQFRGDLFYRINVVSLELPPLRDRRADITLLAEYFLRRYSDMYRRELPVLSRNSTNLMLQHNWPGNIRELENLIRRYVILGSEDVIAKELLGYDADAMGEKSGQSEVSLKSLTRQAVRDLERRTILGVLHANNWNRKETARLLKISYRALLYKIKDAGLPPKRMPRNGPDDNRSPLRSGA